MYHTGQWVGWEELGAQLIVCENIHLVIVVSQSILIVSKAE